MRIGIIKSVSEVSSILIRWMGGEVGNIDEGAVIRAVIWSSVKHEKKEWARWEHADQQQ